jgi:hypothetical protein
MERPQPARHSRTTTGRGDGGSSRASFAPANALKNQSMVTGYRWLGYSGRMQRMIEGEWQANGVHPSLTFSPRSPRAPCKKEFRAVGERDGVLRL